MKTKIPVLFVMVLIGAVSIASTNTFKKIKYSIKPVEGVWMVVDDTNGQAGPIRADKNDDIEWTAVDSDVVFQFPVALSSLFTKEDGTAVGDNYVVRVTAGDKLKLKVKSDAPTGEYIYSVFVLSAQTYAEGSSPPVMIIK